MVFQKRNSIKNSVLSFSSKAKNTSPYINKEKNKKRKHLYCSKLPLLSHTHHFILRNRLGVLLKLQYWSKALVKLIRCAMWLEHFGCVVTYRKKYMLSFNFQLRTMIQTFQYRILLNNYLFKDSESPLRFYLFLFLVFLTVSSKCECVIFTSMDSNCLSVMITSLWWEVFHFYMICKISHTCFDY